MATRKIRNSQLEISWKDAVLTTTGLTTGSNVNINAAPNTLDGASLAVRDRVLLRHQTDQTENGIYVVVTPGTGSDGVYERAPDYQTGEIVVAGTATLCLGGTHGGQIFYITTNSTNGFTIDTDAHNWDVNWDYLGLAKGDLFIENHNGDVDGSNVTVTTLTPFFAFGAVTGPTAVQYDTILVFLNGMQLEAGTDYTHDGIDTITLAFAPKASPGNPDKLKVHYYQYIQ